MVVLPEFTCLLPETQSLTSQEQTLTGRAQRYQVRPSLSRYSLPAELLS